MYDILLWGGRVVDVHTRTSRIANLAIKDGRIACISGTDLPAERVIDCRGLVVSPGFIDPHGHLDGHIYAGQLSALQGITTTIGGNCGLSPLDLPEFFAAQQKQGYPIHQAEMIGHSFTLRRAVGIEDENVPATPSQVQEMERLARKGLEAGACGVSLGLDYSPGAGEEEILAMSRLAAEYGRTKPLRTRLRISERRKNSGKRLVQLWSMFLHQPIRRMAGSISCAITNNTSSFYRPYS